MTRIYNPEVHHWCEGKNRGVVVVVVDCAISDGMLPLRLTS